MPINVAISGDSTIGKRCSVCKDESFLALVKLFRDADLAFTHLETVLHDYDGPEVYPSAQAGWTWMRAPLFVAEELKWAGFDVVSNASNHSLDYMYGGLMSTWKALEKAGLAHAGTGMNMSEAREPAYIDTPNARFAMISSSSTFNDWTRAGEARRDIKGRPGLNSLRTHCKVDSATLQAVKELATKMGWWITDIEGECIIHPAGLHNTVSRFIRSEQPGVTVVADEDDVKGNIRAIKDAKTKADFVIFHIHNHEWNTKEELSVPPEFIPPFARMCIDAGADLFVAQGSHSYLRGIEIYEGKPIFYDPGDLFRTRDSVTKLPSDYYFRVGYSPMARKWEATSTDGFEARYALPAASNPKGGYLTAKVLGIVIPVCTFDDNMRLEEIRLYPATHMKKPQMLKGFPGLERGDTAKKIIAYLAELSAPFGTKIDFVDGVGIIKPA